MTYALPVPGGRLPDEGSSRGYLYPRSATHRHNGIDFYEPVGTEVATKRPGVVELASYVWMEGMTDYGRHVVIRHPDGKRSLYAHLEDVDVELGQVVDRHQRLGTIGRTKFSRAGGYVDEFEDDPGHLHFEVADRRYPMPSDADRLDPAEWLDFAALEEQLSPPGVTDSVTPSRRRARRQESTDEGPGAGAILALAVGGWIWLTSG